MRRSKGLKGLVGLVLGVGAVVALGQGCAPHLIQQYDVRDGEVFFVVSQGRSYKLGDCKRAPDGKLTDCKMYEVDFK